MIDLRQVKEYLRVSYDEDDRYLEQLIHVARGYLQDGITNYEDKIKHDRFKAKADMVMLALVQSLYDERYLMGQPLEINYMIRSMMNQLEYGDYDVQSRTKQDPGDLL